jgi:hypothetical protein
MHRFAAFAAMAALILAAPATADAASKKKLRATSSAKVAAEPRHQPARPYGGPWNQPWQSNQRWPTSVNDGSFSYSGGRDFR